MYTIKAFCLLLMLVSCNTETTHLKLASTDASFHWAEGVLYYKEQPYSGVQYELYPDTKDTLSLAAYAQGKLDGLLLKWYRGGKIKEERYYKNGEKNGKQLAYWENGNKKFEFVAQNDAYEGTLREWGIEGNLIHLANFVNGQEEGSQKLWYNNGKIRANYVMRNGKRYGLLGTKNCKNVSDSIFVVQ